VSLLRFLSKIRFSLLVLLFCLSLLLLSLFLLLLFHIFLLFLNTEVPDHSFEIFVLFLISLLAEFLCRSWLYPDIRFGRSIGFGLRLLLCLRLVLLWLRCLGGIFLLLLLVLLSSVMSRVLSCVLIVGGVSLLWLNRGMVCLHRGVLGHLGNDCA